MHKVEIGNEIEWQGRMRKVKKLLGITITLDGVADVICLPVDATRVELFKDAGTESAELDEAKP